MSPRPRLMVVLLVRRNGLCYLELVDAFTQPTYRRFVVLLLACILTTGRRTVTNLLRTVSAPAPGHLAAAAQWRS